MKKRFHTAWRFTVAFLLLTALVAGALVAPVSVGAVTPPDTYIDPIPQFFNDVPDITGTSETRVASRLESGQMASK